VIVGELPFVYTCGLEDVCWSLRARAIMEALERHECSEKVMLVAWRRAERLRAWVHGEIRGRYDWGKRIYGGLICVPQPVEGGAS